MDEVIGSAKNVKKIIKSSKPSKKASINKPGKKASINKPSKSSKKLPDSDVEDDDNLEELSDDELPEELKDLTIEKERDEEEFFNKDSYDKFTQDNGIELLDTGNYLSNSLHKEDIVTPNEYRRTSEIMMSFEYARVISERAKEIENGSPIFIQLTNEFDPIEIAEKEIRQKKCPLKIIRYLKPHIKEEWDVNDMIPPFK